MCFKKETNGYILDYTVWTVATMTFELITQLRADDTYSSVPNRRKQGKIDVQVGKFLKNIKRADANKAVQGGFVS